jgi:hypothetical protein
MIKKLFLMIFLILYGFAFVNAFSGGGDGSIDTPYEIANCTQLQEIQGDVSANYTLVNDIECADTVNWDGGSGFDPISTFTGTFEGQNYKIKNLYLNRVAQDNIGLFHLSSGNIYNVNLENVDITGYYVVGTLIGENDGIIENCSSSGKVTTLNFIVGGLAGSNTYGVIRNSYSTTDVSGTAWGEGGLVGWQGSFITNCYAKGSVYGSMMAGGLVGYGMYKTENSYSAGFVSPNSGEYTSGGFLGYNDGGSSETINSFYNTETSGYSSDGRWSNATGLTTSEMQTQQTFTDAGWDFDTIWNMDSQNNSGYPYLRWQIFPKEPVIFSRALMNNTIGGQPTNFSIEISDDVALHPNGQYIFSTNNTGEWVNDSAVNFTLTPELIFVEKILNSTSSSFFGYRWYFSDNDGNLGSTPIIFFYESMDPIVEITFPIESGVYTPNNWTGISLNYDTAVTCEYSDDNVTWSSFTSCDDTSNYVPAIGINQVLYVRGTDSGNHIGYAVPVTFTYYIAPPIVEITFPIENGVYSPDNWTGITLNYDSAVTCEYSDDNVTWSSFTSCDDTSNYVPAIGINQILYVRGTDSGSYIGHAVPVTFTYAMFLPIVEITSPIENGVYSPDNWTGISLSYNTAVTCEYSDDNVTWSSFASCEDTSNYVPSIGINQVLYVRGTDSGNHIGYAVPVTFTYYIAPPIFTSIPSDASLFYGNESLLVQFVGVDETEFDSYSVNDTAHFGINSSGFLSNKTALAVGNYEINVKINDTSDNINWTIYKVQINKSNYYDCGVYFNASSPISYPYNFIVYTNCSSAYALYRNGTAISNNSIQSLAIGIYNFSILRNDSFNYTFYYNTASMIIADRTFPTFTNVPSDASLFYGNESLLVQFVGVDETEFDSYSVNDTAHFSINSSGFLSNQTALAAGNYEINVTINDTSNNINWTIFNVEVREITNISSTPAAPRSSGGGGGGGGSSKKIVAADNQTNIPNQSNQITQTDKTNSNSPKNSIPSKLFDIKLELESATISNASELSSVIRFESFGSVPTLVNLTYRILDSEDKEVYSEKGEVTVTTEQIVSNNFESLSLPAGQYTLILTTVYGENVTDDFRQEFSIGELKSLKKINNSWILYLIIGVLIISLITVSLAVFLKYKSKRVEI